MLETFRRVGATALRVLASVAAEQARRLDGVNGGAAPEPPAATPSPRVTPTPVDARPLTPEQLAFWNDNGFLVLRGFFDRTALRPVASLFDDLWRDRSRPDNPLVVDLLEGENQGRTMFREVPDSARLVPYKLNDLYLESQAVRDLILAPRLCAVLNQLLEGDPMVCNSLTFERGSQQPFHIDSFYMPPPVEDRLVVSSIALEDVNPAAGPLGYYPGSHKIPAYRFSNGGIAAVDAEMTSCLSYINGEVVTRSLEAKTFEGKAGDVFIWHCQLFHSGTPIRNKRLTRKSVVTHYWRAKDVDPSRLGKVGSGYYLMREHQRVG